MVLEVCVAVIAVTLVVLVVMLVRTGIEMRGAAKEFQEDVKRLCVEVTILSSTLNRFIREDLHPLSEETGELMANLNEFSEEVRRRMNGRGWLNLAVNSLRLGPDSEESETKCETIPQIVKWIGTSVNLIKQFVGKYGKRTR